MGETLKVLSKKMLAGESIYEKFARVENTPDGIHIHWRDMRILNEQYAGTKKMFAEASGIPELASADMAVSVLSDLRDPLFQNIASIELVRGGIHKLHGRKLPALAGRGMPSSFLKRFFLAKAFNVHII